MVWRLREYLPVGLGHQENGSGGTSGDRMLPEHTRSVKLFCNVDASALAAVMFVLLVVMMIAECSPHDGTSPDLPRVSHAAAVPGALREDATIISVTRDGSVYFGNERVSPADLSSKIQNRLTDRSVERRVYIQLDARARYGTLRPTLDSVGSAGIERVAFLVNVRRPSTSPP